MGKKNGLPFFPVLPFLPVQRKNPFPGKKNIQSTCNEYKCFSMESCGISDPQQSAAGTAFLSAVRPYGPFSRFSLFPPLLFMGKRKKN